MNRPFSRCLILLAGIAGIGLSGLPANAQLSIVPTFDSSITSDANAAAIEGVIDAAIATYESKFSDPIIVTISFRSMTTGLGQSNTWLYNLTYGGQFYPAFVADATSSDDGVALANTPGGANNPVTGSTGISIKTANIRALGIPGAFPSGLTGGFDGLIGLNTHITDIGSPGTTGLYSLMAVTEHEIDEVLGLGSVLPNLNFLGGDPFTEDLFRYDNAGARSFTTSSSAKAYFSIDGATLLAQFDNQNDGGDFGDWQSNPLPSGVQPKVQDAFATPGSHPLLGVEFRALDVIGYTLKSRNGQVPEPGALALLLCAAVPAALFARRRK